MGSHRSLRTRAQTVLAAVGACALLTALVAPQAAAQPNPDPVDRSANITQVASLPFQAPFNADSIGTDIAFSGKHAFIGNYAGFTIYDIADPRNPSIVSQVLCPGAQNDVSVSGNLLFLSTDSSRNNNSCNSVGQSAAIKSSWEGIKIFDISDLRNPRYVSAVETDCGSHTHTLVPDPRGRDVYLYISSYSPAPAFPDCQPPFDAISIVKVPKNNPAAASVISEPVVFPDGGNPGSPPVNPPAEFGTSATSGCHDITVYPSKGIAAGACMGDGVLFDIRDPEKPRVTARVTDDQNFAFWHSATFNNSGTKVVFTDELFGGVGAACTAAVGPTRGADGIYDIVTRGRDRDDDDDDDRARGGDRGRGPTLALRSYYKIPRIQDDVACVAHNGSLIPVPGRDIMVQAWYQGGISVFDFTNSRKPREIAFFDRAPRPDGTVGGEPWSVYWYNGFIYSSDISRGLEVFELKDRRTDAANRVRFDELNVQTQPRFRGGGDDD